MTDYSSLSDLIDFVIEKGMLPVVTLIHFDTPLQFYAGNVSSLYEKPSVGYNNGAYQNETFLDSFVVSQLHGHPLISTVLTLVSLVLWKDCHDTFCRSSSFRPIPF